MPSLTERKLMPMGKGALVVTIPKGWAKYLKLKPGDRVEVVADGELIIRPIRDENDGKVGITSQARSGEAQDEG